jgi:hypothetical protein
VARSCGPSDYETRDSDRQGGATPAVDSCSWSTNACHRPPAERAGGPCAIPVSMRCCEPCGE